MSNWLMLVLMLLVILAAEEDFANALEYDANSARQIEGGQRPPFSFAQEKKGVRFIFLPSKRMNKK